jgi:septal ring factor EnvC (AmiA/AmiB activator)
MAEQTDAERLARIRQDNEWEGIHLRTRTQQDKDEVWLFAIIERQQRQLDEADTELRHQAVEIDELSFEMTTTEKTLANVKQSREDADRAQTKIREERSVLRKKLAAAEAQIAALTDEDGVYTDAR